MRANLADWDGRFSGIGRLLALQYAASGAKVCIVGRRQTELDAVKAECRVQKMDAEGNKPSVLGVAADFTVPEDMVRVRDEIETGEILMINVPPTTYLC